MSVLEIPRIYYKGEIAWDPVTTNNYPVDNDRGATATYNENNGYSELNSVAVSAANVAAFRKAAIDEIVGPGSWNPAGTYRSPFFNTYISGVDTGPGLNLDDPFVTAPVSFTGMLIDCEPYGALSSQLFFDNISFGIQGGSRIFGRRNKRFSDRYLNFSANPNNNNTAGPATVVWQNCFDKHGDLEIDPYGSEALQALYDKMSEPDVLGLMTRFVTYRTVYYDDPTLVNGSPQQKAAGQALQAKLAAGGFQPNPARSLLVGTIGLWRRGEAVFEPSERTLLATGVKIPVSSNPQIGPAVCGTAWAHVGEDRVTLDLSSCIPCADRATNKVDLGTLTLTASDPPPAVAVMEVATIPVGEYDRAAYEATSGIVDIMLEPGIASTLARMDLAIKGDGGAYVVETALRAIPRDPNLYINQGDAVSTTVQVYDRGRPAAAGVTVTMSELGASQRWSNNRVTNAAGQVSFELFGGTGAVTGLVFQPGDNPTLPVVNLNPQTFTYMYLRTLPADVTVANLPPTWANVYNYVLSNWEAFAPCMDNWLLLGDQQQVLRYAPIIKRLTDPANFESYRYMPITRDLSVGQRKLLYAFLDGGGKVALAPLTTAQEPPAEVEIDYMALSRAQRSH